MRFLEATSWWTVTLAIALAVVVLLLFKKLKSAFSEDAKYQAELDAYLKTNLSSLEIGRFYERYIGYLFEVEGYEVQYHGATQGYDDLGRDLIVRGGNDIWIVQTKCWAKQKHIQEKHIFQLYGSLEHYRRQKNKPYAKAIFYTTAAYSSGAKEAADLLEIDLRVEKLDRSYPMIKCNVSESSEDKTFHFPFDDDYDVVKIVPRKGDFFARTVKEATSKGFRRARNYKRAG